MKCLLFILLGLMPYAANATKIAVCDGKTYDVAITNGGESHRVLLSPMSGSVEEFGPVVSMQIPGHPPVTVTEPHDNYCIWAGKITLQRHDPIYNGGGK